MFLKFKILCILLIIVVLILEVNSQARLKQQNKENTPIDPFTFLVEGGGFTAAKTIRVEQYDILILVDITYIKWREIMSTLDLTLKAFQNLPFFQDEAIKKEFEGRCASGVSSLVTFTNVMGEILKFKNEAIPDVVVNSCSETPLQFREADLKREITNLNNYFNLINETWTAEEIKKDNVAKIILFDFCENLGDFTAHYENLARDILEALEELTDGTFPSLLLGNFIKNCSNAEDGNGEHYEILNCKNNDKGLRCQVELTQAIKLQNYIQFYPVHYKNIRLKGENIEDLWVRTTDVNELVILQCIDDYLDFPVCTEKPIHSFCKRNLDAEDISGIISSCNFTKEEIKPGTVLPHGGLLVQGEDLEMKNGAEKLVKSPPFVIYSPDIVTIRKDGEDFTYLPPIIVEKLVIVESKLTPLDVEKLVNQYKWENFADTIDYEFYIDVALILLQVAVIPIAIVGLYYAVKQKKMLKKVRNKGMERYKTRENLKNNQMYLLKRVKN